VLELKENQWVSTLFHAHAMGCNAVSWSPSVSPGAVASASGGQQTAPVKRFVTGGSDCLVKIWDFSTESSSYSCIAELGGHQDWVRDVAWAPTILTKSYIASASQDKTVKIWTTTVANPTAGILRPVRTCYFRSILTRVSRRLAGYHSIVRRSGMAR